MDLGRFLDAFERLPEQFEPGAIGAHQAFREALYRHCLPEQNFFFIGTEVPMGEYGTIDCLCSYCETMGEGTEQFARFFALVKSDVEIRIEKSASNVLIAFHHREKSDSFFELYTLGVILSRYKERIPDFRPIEVAFGCDAPEDYEELENYLGCPVQFGQPFAYLRLPRAFWNYPQQQVVDPDLLEALETHANHLLKQCSKRPISRRVQICLLRIVQHGDFSLKRVARELALSPRTLQRRLKEEGSVYQDLVVEVRNSLAKQYLSDSPFSFVEIAFLLGYSKLSAFHRAFKRWTGQTPGEYRQSFTAA